jgi:hypothetical protein
MNDYFQSIIPKQQNPNYMENNATLPNAAEDTGIAYRAVAQSTAIAIQDAVENLRNINTVAATMIGAASAQAIEEPASVDQMQKVIEMAQKITEDAIENLRKVGIVSNQMLQSFPSENI